MSILTPDGIELPHEDELQERLLRLNLETLAARHLLRLVTKVRRQADLTRRIHPSVTTAIIRPAPQAVEVARG